MNELIWIIDDDPVFRLIFRKTFFHSTGIETIREFDDAYAAKEAMEKLESTALPKLILLDINMPIMSGWEFSDWLDNGSNGLSTAHINIYLMTSSIDPADKARAEAYHIIKEYITKPVDSETCRSMADRHILGGS